MRRSARIEVKCTEEEKASWVAQAKPFSLSEYIRQLLLKDQVRREQKA